MTMVGTCTCIHTSGPCSGTACVQRITAPAEVPLHVSSSPRVLLPPPNADFVCEPLASALSSFLLRQLYSTCGCDDLESLLLLTSSERSCNVIYKARQLQRRLVPLHWSHHQLPHSLSPSSSLPPPLLSPLSLSLSLSLSLRSLPYLNKHPLSLTPSPSTSHLSSPLPTAKVLLLLSSRLEHSSSYSSSCQAT